MQGTYQQGLIDLGTLYVTNFFVSIIPATIIANWLYFTSDRNILVSISFHFILVATAELFQTETFTKCLFPVILCIVALILVATHSTLFRRSPRKDSRWTLPLSIHFLF